LPKLNAGELVRALLRNQESKNIIMKVHLQKIVRDSRMS